MNRLAFFAFVPALALMVSGCGKQGAQHVTRPLPRSEPPIEFRDARWIRGEAETREAAARAAKSPLMEQAVRDVARNPHISFFPSGVVGAVGTAPDGSPVRFTVLPYQDTEDLNHAVYFALVEGRGSSRVESFELIRGRRPTPEETEYERVNAGENGLWMRSGPIYVATQSGAIVRRAPERFNWVVFSTCFIPLADRMLGEVREVCGGMGSFPGCVTFGSIGALVGAALYCAYIAMYK